MPRKADAQLEGRILDAAYRLWGEQGERALTMRAVARASGTTTPTVYERFRDKEDLLEQLRNRARQNLFDAIRPGRSLAEIFERYLAFAARYPHEYELLSRTWAARLTRKEPRPGHELVRIRLAERLGGTPAMHRRLALALTALAHGTSTLLLQEGVHERISRELRRACLDAVETLLEGASGSASRSKRGSAR
jgi:AcrR family transcriptional regulator